MKISINQKTKKIFPGIFFLLSLFFIQNTKAEVIFEDNFNDAPDWHTNKYAESFCYSEGCRSGDSLPPLKWPWYHSDESWNPYSVSNPVIGSQPSMQISSYATSNFSDKSFVVFNESNRGLAGDGWGADALLARYLDQDFKEIYAQIKIKFQPSFQLYWVVNGNASILKIFRILHFDGTGNPFVFFENGNVSPIYLFDIVNNEYGNQFSTSMRCDPQETQYYCAGNSVPYRKYTGNINWQNSFGDGNWHTLNWHLKMNSNLDSKDGIVEFWLDGVNQLSKFDMDWIRTGGDINAGWNMVGIGGNAYNNYKQISIFPFQYQLDAEQWYTIDDVVVSTTPIPDGYVIGGNQPPITFNISNFTTLLSNWLKKESDNAADLNSDGIINSRDLGIMMGKWN